MSTLFPPVTATLAPPATATLFPVKIKRFPVKLTSFPTTTFMDAPTRNSKLWLPVTAMLFMAVAAMLLAVRVTLLVVSVTFWPTDIETEPLVVTVMFLPVIKIEPSAFKMIEAEPTFKAISPSVTDTLLIGPPDVARETLQEIGENPGLLRTAVALHGRHGLIDRVCKFPGKHGALPSNVDDEPLDAALADPL